MIILSTAPPGVCHFVIRTGPRYTSIYRHSNQRGSGFHNFNQHYVVASSIFYFYPKPFANLGEMDGNLTSIVFQMGWFNHQVEQVVFRLRLPCLLPFLLIQLPLNHAYFPHQIKRPKKTAIIFDGI